MNSRHWFAFGFLLLLGLAGCHKAPSKPSLSPVRGTVTYKGQPITQGAIGFESENSTIHSCSSVIKEGAFNMNTFAGGTSPDGAMPGKYRVAVTGTVGTGKEAKPVPKRYEDVGTSGLTVEIKAGGDTNLNINIP